VYFWCSLNKKLRRAPLAFLLQKLAYKKKRSANDDFYIAKIVDVILFTGFYSLLLILPRIKTMKKKKKKKIDLTKSRTYRAISPKKYIADESQQSTICLLKRKKKHNNRVS
jgi:hypothetical protein